MSAGRSGPGTAYIVAAYWPDRIGAQLYGVVLAQMQLTDQLGGDGCGLWHHGAVAVRDLPGPVAADLPSAPGQEHVAVWRHETAADCPGPDDPTDPLPAERFLPLFARVLQRLGACADHLDQAVNEFELAVDDAYVRGCGALVHALLTFAAGLGQRRGVLVTKIGPAVGCGPRPGVDTVQGMWSRIATGDVDGATAVWRDATAMPAEMTAAHDVDTTCGDPGCVCQPGSDAHGWATAIAETVHGAVHVAAQTAQVVFLATVTPPSHLHPRGENG